MFTIELDKIICQIIDSVLNRNDSHISINPGVIRKKGIIFKNIRLTIIDPKNARCKATTECMLICCGTSVFSIIRNENHKRFTWRDILNTEWINLSNHDSCWIDAIRSFFNEIYFELCENVNNKVAPITLETNVCLGFSQIFELINVDLITDPIREPGNNYWKKIVNIESILPTN